MHMDTAEFLLLQKILGIFLFSDAVYKDIHDELKKNNNKF